MIWKPNVTVAAVIEQDGRFLLVEEETEDGLRFNQPAGHLECREALVDAVVREALEETGYHFAPRFLVGIYSWRNEARGRHLPALCLWRRYRRARARSPAR